MGEGAGDSHFPIPSVSVQKSLSGPLPASVVPRTPPPPGWSWDPRAEVPVTCKPAKGSMRGPRGPSLPGMALTDPRGPWVGWADDWEGPEAQRPRARPQVTGSGPQPRWGPAQSYPLLWSSALPAPQGGLDWAFGGGAKKRGLGEVGSKDHSSSPLHSVPARSQVVPG